MAWIKIPIERQLLLSDDRWRWRETCGIFSKNEEILKALKSFNTLN